MGIVSEKTESGLKIISVMKESAAQKSGLQKNDVLISMDGEFLDSREELTILLSSKKPNDMISIQLNREGLDMSIQVPLGSRPQK